MNQEDENPTSTFPKKLCLDISRDQPDDLKTLVSQEQKKQYPDLKNLGQFVT